MRLHRVLLITTYRKDLAVNPLLTGLAIPTALAASDTIARSVQSLVSPFAGVLQTALGQVPGSRGVMEIASGDAEHTATAGRGAAQEPNLALLGELLTGQPQRPGQTGIDLAEVRVRAAGLRDDLQRRLQQAFSGAGIAAGMEVRLRVNPDGGTVEVVGDHPQRVAIEGVFAGDPQLSQDFRNLTAIGQLLQAADSRREFSELYGKNPWAAVARFPELFGGSRQAMLTFSPSGAEARLNLDAMPVLS